MNSGSHDEAVSKRDVRDGDVKKNEKKQEKNVLCSSIVNRGRAGVIIWPLSNVRSSKEQKRHWKFSMLDFAGL